MESGCAAHALSPAHDDGDCTICRRGEPLDTIYSTQCGWVTMPQRTQRHGHVCLVLRPHIRDLSELDGEAVLTLLRQLSAVSEALSAVTGAAALRYELNDRAMPHFHLHIYPLGPNESGALERLQQFEWTSPWHEQNCCADLRHRMVAALGRSAA